MKISNTQADLGVKECPLVKEIKAGRHDNLSFNSTEHERHHMPCQSAGNKGGGGGAIVMDKEDHRMTASCDNRPGSAAYRLRQKELIEQGKFHEALEMDITDIRSKFDNKYDKQIEDLISFYRLEGLIK